MKEQGIPTMIYYPKPMHKQDAFADLQCGDEDYAVTNKLCKTVLELPMHPYMEDADIEKIVNMIAACLKENRY